jgi:hypothetical protein
MQFLGTGAIIPISDTFISLSWSAARKARARHPHTSGQFARRKLANEDEKTCSRAG